MTESKLFYQLLDEYFNALVKRPGALPADIAVPRQTQIDAARMAIIEAYELFAGKGAATDGRAKMQAFTRARCVIVETFTDGSLALTMKVAAGFTARGTEFEIRPVGQHVGEGP